MTDDERRTRSGGPDARDLISVSEARTRVLATFQPTDPLRVPLIDALGLVLTHDVDASRDVPPFSNSAMDGYACRSVDVALATRDEQVALPVTKTITAGDEPGELMEPGTAIRIMTGAPLPAGADVVVPFERAEFVPGDPDTVRIRRRYTSGENTRMAGEDMRVGQVVLPAGRRLRASDIAVLAAIGEADVSVHRRPRVAILATGDEVVPPGETPGPGQIWDSNSSALAAMVQQAGGIPIVLGVARDNESAIRDKLDAEPGIDLYVTAGGVSAGDLDVVKDILRADDKIAFWQVRIKPGRPLAFGSFAGVPMLGLPGSPVAVAVTFLQFARPAILTMLGRTDLHLPTIHARMMDAADNGGARQHYIRVVVSETADGYEARLAGAQGAAVLSTLAKANGLLVVPETMEAVEPGTVLPVEMPDWDLG